MSAHQRNYELEPDLPAETLEKALAKARERAGGPTGQLPLLAEPESQDWESVQIPCALCAVPERSLALTRFGVLLCWYCRMEFSEAIGVTADDEFDELSEQLHEQYGDWFDAVAWEPPDDADEFGAWYAVYLTSPAWRSRRVACLAAADWHCELCPGRAQLECHHLTYDRVGDEDPDDLMCLCRRCHSAEHAPAVQGGDEANEDDEASEDEDVVEGLGGRPTVRRLEGTESADLPLGGRAAAGVDVDTRGGRSAVGEPGDGRAELSEESLGGDNAGQDARGRPDVAGSAQSGLAAFTGIHPAGIAGDGDRARKVDVRRPRREAAEAQEQAGAEALGADHETSRAAEASPRYRVDVIWPWPPGAPGTGRDPSTMRPT